MMRKLLISLLVATPFLGSANSIDSLKLELSKAIEDTSKAVILMNIGRQYEDKAQYIQAFEQYLKALKKIEFSEHYLLLGQIKTGLGNTTGYTGDYNNSTKFYLEAIENFDKTSSPMNSATIYGNIGINYVETGDFKRSKIYYWKAIDQLTTIQDSALIATSGIELIYLNLGSLYGLENQLDSAILYCDMAKELLANSRPNYSIIYYLNMVDIHIRQENFEKAQQFIELADSVQSTYKLNNNVSGILSSQAELYLKKGQLNEALRLAIESLNISIGNQLHPAISAGYDLISRIYEEKKEFDSALKFIELGNDLAEKISNPEVIEQINHRLENFEKTKLEAQNQLEIDLLDKDKEESRIIWIMIFSSISVFGLLIFLIYYRNRNKKSISQLLLEKQEISEVQLQNEKLFQTKNITNLALFISKKNDFIRHIKDQISEIRTDDKYEDFEEIDNLIQTNLEKTQDKKDLEEQIKNMSEGFFTKLTTQFPNLTNKDKQLCSLLILQLSSKEISSILDINVGSVEKSRYRLRKKLDLSADDNLSMFLSKL